MTDEAEKAYEAQIEAMARAAYEYRVGQGEWDRARESLKMVFRKEHRAAAEAIGLTPGCVVVSAEASKAMLDAGYQKITRTLVDCGKDDDMQKLWGAMIAAALPRHPEKEGA